MDELTRCERMSVQRALGGRSISSGRRRLVSVGALLLSVGAILLVLPSLVDAVRSGTGWEAFRERLAVAGIMIGFALVHWDHTRQMSDAQAALRKICQPFRCPECGRTIARVESERE